MVSSKDNTKQMVLTKDWMYKFWFVRMEGLKQWNKQVIAQLDEVIAKSIG